MDRFCWARKTGQLWGAQMSEIRLYIDVEAVAALVDWESVVVDAVDALAWARAERYFYGIERRYYYVGTNPERGALWTEEEHLSSIESLSGKRIGSSALRRARSRVRGRKGRKRRIFSQRGN